MRATAVLLLVPLLPAADPAAGKRIFESQCAVCHGQNARGGRGPSLIRPVLAKAPDEATLHKVISEGIEPEMPGAWQLSPGEIASVAIYVRMVGTQPALQVPGDAIKGAAIYRAKGCAGCHIIDGAGSGFGPELTDVGARRSAAHLAESITRPAASLPDEFQILTVDSGGKKTSGVRVNEDTFSVQIRDQSGRNHSFNKSANVNIRKRKGETPMPAYDLPPEELTNLVAYLASLRGRS